MRDRDRSTACNLFAEDRDHAPRAPQHVSESHRHEARAARAGEPLDDHLGDALAGPHHRAGPHRLVGRDEYERIHRALLRGLRQRDGAEDVVLHRLTRVLFHHLDVLVCGGVQHERRPIPLEDAPHPRFVSDVGNQRYDAGSRGARTQLPIDVEEGVFVVIEQQQLPWHEGKELPA